MVQHINIIRDLSIHLGVTSKMGFFNNFQNYEIVFNHSTNTKFISLTN